MRIAHGFGTEADAKSPPFDRITWIPGPLVFADAGFSTQHAEVSQFLEAKFRVMIYGGSALEVYQRAAQFAGWLDVLAGPKQGDPEVNDRPGYDIENGGTPIGGGTGAGTWRLEVGVTLKDFVIRRDMPPAPILSATVQIDAADQAGAEQAIPDLAGPP